jgi:post-segregation antitoxin (ccd killing protein)
MPKQNITLSLDKDLIRQARQISVRKSMSVSKLLSEELERLVRDHEQYEQAKRSALAALKKGVHMGGTIAATRNQIHERQGLR